MLSPCPGIEGLYRGLTKSIDNQTATIYFIDYGNTESVPIEQLFNVNEKLATTPCGVVKTPKVKGTDEEGFTEPEQKFLGDNDGRKCVVVLEEGKDEVDFMFSDGLVSETFARYKSEEEQKERKRVEEEEAKRREEVEREVEMKKEEEEDERVSVIEEELKRDSEEKTAVLKAKKSRTSLILNNLKAEGKLIPYKIY